ncbi:BQ5605_C037g11606 [Microbotryum silenes-dioicae]|uniref:pyridoxal 5'-phosphate synthase n=1 Tax=Microbotryum silenes-dioicae TaxID=796604 RepID=A0A2X0MF69_9BASI|nr:BQ5605_C037g11606 [Microbotryum silenes-dioicae]
MSLPCQPRLGGTSSSLLSLCHRNPFPTWTTTTHSLRPNILAPTPIPHSQHSSMSSPTPQAQIKIDNHETYLSQGIPSASSLSPDPIAQFREWFSSALADKDVIEPEAMTVSTVSAEGIPSTRVVLLKQVDDKGWIFYTNYESRKGRELFPQTETEAETGTETRGSYASLAFYWRALHLSVRVVGRAEKVTPQETKTYFDSRPVGSRIGAWASKQSSELSGREELEEQVKAMEWQFGVPEGTSIGTASAVAAGPKGQNSSKEAENVDVSVPPFWGGVRIVPFEVEFWAGRPSRLHDRFRYTRDEGSDGAWKIVRLSP